jgi:hypothetical protein
VTGEAGAEPEPLGRLGDAADHAPDERAVALRVDPWVKVVGDQGEAEAGSFGALCEANEVVRGMLFAGERVAELWHGPIGTGPRRG